MHRHQILIKLLHCIVLYLLAPVMSDSAPKIVTGGCLCRAHTFSIDASKIRFGFASCHCSICRLSHSAPFVQWAGMNAENSTPDIFQVHSKEGTSLSVFRTSSSCSRFFCSTCGTHVYIKYDDASVENPVRWGGEVHFPTALVDTETFSFLEETVIAAGRPRYLHVFTSDRHPCLGNLLEWSTGPKYGGVTGLEPVNDQESE